MTSSKAISFSWLATLIPIEISSHRKYGENFRSHANITALHSSEEYEYHGDLFFLTSHPAMQLQVKFDRNSHCLERSNLIAATTNKVDIHRHFPTVQSKSDANHTKHKTKTYTKTC